MRVKALPGFFPKLCSDIADKIDRTLDCLYYEAS